MITGEFIKEEFLKCYGGQQAPFIPMIIWDELAEAINAETLRQEKFARICDCDVCLEAKSRRENKDTERLDWVEEEVIRHKQGVLIIKDREQSIPLRQAIDQTMKEGK